MGSVSYVHSLRMRGGTIAKTATLANYDRSVRRRAVNLSLNEGLLVRARQVTKNLSATVEELLAGFVHQEQARWRTEDEALDQVIKALNDFHSRNGFLSDKFSTL